MVGISGQRQHFGVVHESVDHGGGHYIVGEGLSPAPKGQVAGHQNRADLAAGGDQLEEQVRGVLVKRNVADLVDDDQFVSAGLVNSASRRLSRCAAVRRAIQFDAVSNSTEYPAWAALTPKPMAR